MADVRALLRQQRAARRITHPYATYSDTGKLLCTLCREQIRAESHWDAHLASDKHRKRLSALSENPTVNGNRSYREGDEANEQEQTEELDDVEGRDQRADTPSATHKRKLDTTAEDHDADNDQDMDDEDEVRRKRSRHASPENGRRKPQGPSQGVQVEMPSRSTTPADSQHSSSSAAKTTTTKLATSLPSRQASNLATPASSSSMSIQQQEPQQQEPQSQPQPQPPASTSTPQNQQVDEDEWAAFEADIAAESAPYDADAVISRPAMTAEEAAAAKEAAEQEEALQNPESRKTRADADIEDEREEATRALEDEFEEMQELEARVRRLKEKREALMRKRGETVGQDGADDDDASVQATTKPASDARGEGTENAMAPEDSNGVEAEKEDEDEDEDEDDDEEDDWDGFRFRTGR